MHGYSHSGLRSPITTHLSTSALKTINSFPVVCVPAQGANTIIVPFRAFLYYHANTTGFDAAPDGFFCYDDVTKKLTLVSQANLNSPTWYALESVFETTDRVAWTLFTNQINGFAPADYWPPGNDLNQALRFGGSADSTTGDGDAYLTVWFAVMDLTT